MMKIWGRDNSVNVEKVLWVCEELGLPFERVDAGGQFGIVDTPQYRAMNPNGLVPTVEVDGLVLWESNAIVRYLAAKHSAGDLWPNDLAVRVEADRWMDWGSTVFWPAFRPLFWNLVRTLPEQRNRTEIARSFDRSAEVLGYLDNHLADRRHIAGDRFTMGDIPMGCAVWRWLALPEDLLERPRPKYAALGRWFDTLSERPCYRKVVMRPLS
ncbi:MAG: glutathione S-transferase [Betaproteobacteria bacterium SG8_40]|nr:MAG: glutathione S-transferase [Betaproteobacteria bacterium SG8_40]